MSTILNNLAAIGCILWGGWLAWHHVYNEATYMMTLALILRQRN